MRKIFLALLLLPAFMQAQSIAQKADELLTAYTEQNKFSGNVLIAKEGKVIFEKAYGFADRATKKPNTQETEFRVGSLTKMFTSALILQLAEASKLSLTDPVSKYVPAFPDGDKIQIVHLLSHTSGIKGSTAAPEPTTLATAVTQFKTSALAFTPGSKFEYNNFNYILLSYIAQQVTGTEFPRLLQTNVLSKAGMQHAGLDVTHRASSAKAIGYVTNPQTVAWEPANEGNVAMASGAGALYATASDLYRWSEAVSKHTFVSEAMLQKALQPVQNNYGLGWMISNKNGRTQIGHTGSIPGFIANFMKFPKEDVTIILLSNYQDVNGQQLSDDLVAVTFNEPYSIPKQKKEIALSAAAMNRLAGEYVNNGFTITVSVQNNRLYALAQGDQDSIELTPESDKKFFLKGPETEIEFMEEGGAIKYMFVNMQGGQKFTKVK